MDVKVLDFGRVPLKKLKPFQPDGLKRQTTKEKQLLIESLKANGLSSPFFVFKKGKSVFVLDGHHRIEALKEIYKDIDVPVVYIDVKTERQAKELLLLYNSRYSHISYTGLADWLDFSFDFASVDEIRFEEFQKDVMVFESDSVSGKQTAQKTDGEPVQSVEKIKPSVPMQTSEYVILEFSKDEYSKLEKRFSDIPRQLKGVLYDSGIFG